MTSRSTAGYDRGLTAGPHGSRPAMNQSADVKDQSHVNKSKDPNAVALGKKRQASMTREQRSELARKAVATRIRTAEQRQADGRKGAEIANANMTPEQRSANAGKAGAAAAANSTPEQRSERARKAALARHAKKKQKPEVENG